MAAAAKENKKRKFYALYDKIYAEDTLIEAWNRVRANKGAAGVDKQTLADIELQGGGQFLLDCQNQLKQGKYNPQPVRRSTFRKRLVNNVR